MKIAVFGLGYVGSVTAAVLAERGHTVVGVDTSRVKVDLITRGASPVLEAYLPERIAAVVKDGRLKAVSDPALAGNWQVAFVCVPTPSGPQGQLDTFALNLVLTEIGRHVRERNDYVVVAIRSTTHPHVLKEIVIPAITKACGTAPGEKYGLVVSPEFLREGYAIADFLDPPFTLIGESDARAGDMIQELFQFIDAPVLRLTLGEAMMVKYASNAYHALKVAFANEIGLLCAHDGLDSHRVMNAFCHDTKLNISQSYLRPGFAFGGSCLPKDLRVLNHRARQANLETPVLDSILSSNCSYLQKCIDRVLATNCKSIGILGVSFKPGTDDLRESPMIQMIEALIGNGKEINIYDSNVNLSLLLGSNREYVETMIPHVASLVRATIAEVVDASQVVVLGHYDPEFTNVSELMREDQILIEFSKPFGVSAFREHRLTVSYDKMER